MKKNHIMFAVFVVLIHAFSLALYGRMNAADIKAKSTINTMLKAGYRDPVVISQKEKQMAEDRINDARAGNIQLECIDAYNNYNFCMLANKMLGSLYKSHGCLHVSPVNIRLLSTVLPVGSVLEIKPYDAGYDVAKAKDVPPLASLIDFKSDLKDMKNELSSKNDVRTVIYPGKNAYVIFLNEAPYAALSVQGGPKEKMNMYQYRDAAGNPVFDDDFAFPTPAGRYFIFKKLDNYISNTYRDQTTVPMGAMIRKINGKWMFEASEDVWKSAPLSIAQDIEKQKADQLYDYFDRIDDVNGSIMQVRWASNTFGSHPIMISKDMKHASAELIHTTCDLIIDDYTMLSVMVDVLSAPYSTFDECTANTDSDDIYKTCYNFLNDPVNVHLDPQQSASYKLYYDMPLTADEQAAIPADAIIANKIVKGLGALSDAEQDLLIKEGIAEMKNGKIKININMGKINGLQFYTYQNVVMIKKYANFYSTLKDNWDDLFSLRTAIVNDMKNLSISDVSIFKRFAVELMIKRIAFTKLTKDGVLDDLEDTLGIQQ